MDADIGGSGRKTPTPKGQASAAGALGLIRPLIGLIAVLIAVLLSLVATTATFALTAKINAGTNRPDVMLSYALDVGCTVLAALAAIGVAFQVRQCARSLELRARFTEARAAELEAFAFRVAHDLGNPLAAVELVLERLRRTRDEEKRAQLHGTADRCMRLAQSLMDGLLMFARAGAQPEPGAEVDASSVCRDVVAELSPLAATTGVELIEQSGPHYVVACNRGVFISILGNLIQNAIKHMGEAPVRRVSVRLFCVGNRLRCEVDDSGPGLSPSRATVAFEPQVRGPGTSAPGIGLGLATVKRLVEGHGGTVGVKSALGRGSTFWVELPSAALPIDADRAALPLAQRAGNLD